MMGASRPASLYWCHIILPLSFLEVALPDLPHLEGFNSRQMDDGNYSVRLTDRVSVHCYPQNPFPGPLQGSVSWGNAASRRRLPSPLGNHKKNSIWTSRKRILLPLPLVPKKNRGWHQVLDLHWRNIFIWKLKFCIVTLAHGLWLDAWTMHMFTWTFTPPTKGSSGSSLVKAITNSECFHSR